MWRWLPLLVVLSLPVTAQEKTQPKKEGELQRQRNKPPAKSGKEEVPAEEDKAVAPESYDFNPLQSQKEIDTGNFYYKKGSYRAAAGRYREATKWNDGNAEAWLRLGEAEEKLKDRQAAGEAYRKYLELSPDSKNAGEIQKKLDK